MKKAWILSYLGWSESSLGAQSLCWFCHVAAQMCLMRTQDMRKMLYRNTFIIPSCILLIILIQFHLCIKVYIPKCNVLQAKYWTMVLIICRHLVLIIISISSWTLTYWFYRYIEFIEHSSELNDLDSFPQLTERSKSIGYSVSKVVFRGYFAYDKLQKLHDGAIEVRTKLKIAVSQCQHSHVSCLKKWNNFGSGREPFDLSKFLENVH